MFTPSHGWWGEEAGAGGSACRPDSNPRPSSCRPVSFWAGGLCGHRPSPHLGSRKWHGASPCRTARQAPTPPPGVRALSLQSSTQEIGEELVNGVIYSISLRKVQVHHGANKGQRWLGVSVDGGSPCPEPREGLGSRGHPGHSTGLPPRAFLPEGPPVLLPKESGPSPLPCCPALGWAKCIVHCSLICMNIKKDTFILFPLHVRRGLFMHFAPVFLVLTTVLPHLLQGFHHLT